MHPLKRDPHQRRQQCRIQFRFTLQNLPCDCKRQLNHFSLYSPEVFGTFVCKLSQNLGYLQLRVLPSALALNSHPLVCFRNCSISAI